MAEEAVNSLEIEFGIGYILKVPNRRSQGVGVWKQRGASGECKSIR
jgi:hypothetical protein